MNEFNLKYGFENNVVAKIFDVPSNDKKVWKKKKMQIPMKNLNDKVQTL